MSSRRFRGEGQNMPNLLSMDDRAKASVTRKLNAVYGVVVPSRRTARPASSPGRAGLGGSIGGGFGIGGSVDGSPRSARSASSGLTGRYSAFAPVGTGAAFVQGMAENGEDDE
jgi:hypothetical protein